MHIKYSKGMDPSFIHDVQAIDRVIYKASECATFETDSERYKKNTDTYILLYEEEKLIGYMCIFPITEAIYEEMLKSDVGYDDNITSNDICEYTRDTNLFIHSVVIHPRHQGGEAIKLITNAYGEFLQKKEDENLFMKRIVALAVSEDGKKFLSRLGLLPYKVLKHDYVLYICEKK